MNWYGHGIGGWGYALTAIIMILFRGAVIAGVVVLTRYLGRGEIDEDEYHRRLTALRATGPTRTP
jgi:putative membrane protein